MGVIIGEYGLLGDDKGSRANQIGEKVKYYEYMNFMASQKGICLMMWDNGGFINRLDTKKYSWKQPLVGAIIEAANKRNRSSYATGINEIYLSQRVDNGVQIPLTLNDNKFKGIKGLTNGKEYTYDEASATITLSKDFVNSRFNKLHKYGSIADLVIMFSKGADWHQYLIKYIAPVLNSYSGKTNEFNIPVDFNGTILRRATAYLVNEDGTDGYRVGPNAGWWSYLEYGPSSSFVADYDNSTINIQSGFFSDGSVPTDGVIKFTFEFYDGQIINYILTKTGENVTGISEVK